MIGTPRDIFLVCNNFEEIGGLQIWIRHIGRLLAARGHRVHLVGITHAGDRRLPAGELPFPQTVLHETDPALRRSGRFWRALRRADRAAGARRLAAVLETAEPGGVIIAAQVWAMEWVAAAGAHGMPVIGMSHEAYDATLASSRYERVLRHFGDADRMLVLTGQDADAWARDGLSNVDSMPNPLHVTPSRLSTLSEPAVVRLGRLSHEKGQDMLLDAWSLARPGTAGWLLRIHGSGPLEGALRGQAERLGIADSVELPGPTRDIEGALLAGSVFAQTSRAEGFPMSILEAMAYGLPCVAFDCAPGLRELITDGVDGFLVHPGNTVEFAARLNRLIADPELRHKMGRAAAESVGRFAPDRVIDRWERLFDLLQR